MRIAIAADERVGAANALEGELRRRGHETIAHGALDEAEREAWAWACEVANVDHLREIDAGAQGGRGGR